MVDRDWRNVWPFSSCSASQSPSRAGRPPRCPCEVVARRAGPLPTPLCIGLCIRPTAIALEVWWGSRRSPLRTLEDVEGGPIPQWARRATHRWLDGHQLPPLVPQHVQAAFRRVRSPPLEFQVFDLGVRQCLVLLPGPDPRFTLARRRGGGFLLGFGESLPGFAEGFVRILDSLLGILDLLLLPRRFCR